jgi:hypothetical protein
MARLLAMSTEAIAFEARIEELISLFVNRKAFALLRNNICSPRILLNILLIRFFHRTSVGPVGQG